MCCLEKKKKGGGGGNVVTMEAIVNNVEVKEKYRNRNRQKARTYSYVLEVSCFPTLSAATLILQELWMLSTFNIQLWSPIFLQLQS